MYVNCLLHIQIVCDILVKYQIKHEFANKCKILFINWMHLILKTTNNFITLCF